ncbi:histidine kinase N-terminal 7TM domain-containing protein [Evansella tamaricis]|uniref:histidine kinase n=1 Tax=Evansella tamaricis TaxID=2069301 RepID=A0ABS6JAE3_9BACI|nr:histidine kinase N-terminal 7TM domain-containing protein [Evansella tamaricis]MBU9710653.1 PAS domain S-box protein [Evansella tamaricis]
MITENFSASIYPALFLLSALIMCILALLTLKYRSNTFAKYFILFLLLNAFQSVSSIFEVTSTNLETMIVWRNLQQIPLFLSPVLLFTCSLECMGKSRFAKNTLGFILFPVLAYLILIFTDSIHHLMRSEINVLQYSGISRLAIESTPLSSVFIFYTQLLVLLSFVLLIANVVRKNGTNRNQTIFMIVLISFIIIRGLSQPWLNYYGLDFIALAYIPAGFIIFFALRKQSVFTVYPIAKDYIIENMADGIIVFDKKYRIVEFNSTAQQLVNSYSKVKLDATNVPAPQEIIKYIKDFEQNQIEKFDYHYWNDGESLEFELKISHIKDKKDKLLGFLMVIHDVSEYKQLHRELEKSERERLELFSNVSHDLRNPLTSIIGFSEAMLNGKAETNRKYIQYIYDKSMYIHLLVEDLLYLTKLEAKAEKFVFEEINSIEYFQKLCKILKEEVTSQEKHFQCNIDKTLPDIFIDNNGIVRVIDNLISNALKYTEKGATIGFSIQNQGSHLKILVWDTGTGIHPENLPNVFIRYFTDHKTATSHGLGLPICKQIVEMHGGEMGVTSNYGEGSTFYFTLPVMNNDMSDG